MYCTFNKRLRREIAISRAVTAVTAGSVGRLVCGGGGGGIHRHTKLSLSAAHCPSGGDMNTLPLPHTHSWYTLGSLSSTPLFCAAGPGPATELCRPADHRPPSTAGAPVADGTLLDVFAVFSPLKNTLAASIWICERDRGVKNGTERTRQAVGTSKLPRGPWIFWD